MDIEIKTPLDHLNDLEDKIYHLYINKKISFDTAMLMKKHIEALKIGVEIYKIT